MKAVANKNQPGSSTAPGPLERLQGHLGVQLRGTPHESPGGQVVSVAPAQGRGAAGTPEVPAEGQHNTHPLLMVCTPKPRAPSRSHHAFDCRLLLLLSLRGRAKPSGLVCSLLFRGSSQNTQLWATAQTKPRRDRAPSLPPPPKPPAEPGDRILCVSGAPGQLQVALVFFWEQIWLGFFSMQKGSKCSAATLGALNPWHIPRALLPGSSTDAG